MTPAALYLQDAHPIREGMDLRAVRRGQGLRRGVAGREPPRARGDGADGRVRRRDRAHQGRLRRGRLLEPQPGPAGGHVLHARRPGAGPGHPRHRRVVGSAGRQGRHRAGAGRSRSCARSSPSCGPCCTTRPSPFDGEYVHLDGVELDYVYQERRPKDVPIYIGATGMQMMELTGEIADGVVLNYLVSPAYNAPGHGAPRHRRARGPGAALDDIDRPQLVVCSRRRGPRARPSTWPASWSPSTSASSPTS